MSKLEVLNYDCVACQSEAQDNLDPSTATLTILLMLKSGIPLEQILSDLCLTHSRRLGLTVVKEHA